MPQDASRPRRSTAPTEPTRAQLWSELCDTREVIVSLIKENNRVIAENTLIMKQMQVTLNEGLTKIASVTQGVPLKVFLIVVGVLVVILLVVAGIDVKQLTDLVK